MIDQLQHLLQEAFWRDSIGTYFMMFGGGLLASVTPCTYPVLPLTVGYIGNRAGANRLKAFFLSVSMVIGMAVVYAILGSIVAAVGGTFGSIMGNGWALYAIAMYFMIMGLFLLDVFYFPVPEFVSRLQAKSANGRGIFGAFVMGGVSGLICGPCTGPILAVAFGAMAITLQNVHGVDYALQVVKGGLLLFLFGLGQGALILLAGIFTSFISNLPKAGAWMVAVKKAFALMLILAATLLFVLVGQTTNFPNLIQLLASSGNTAATVPKPIATPSSQQQPPEKPTENQAPDFTLASLDGSQITLSTFKGKKGIVLVFFATWCVNCMKEVPDIKKYAKIARTENIEVLAINYKQQQETVERFNKSNNINYRILLDTEGTVSTVKYGVKGIPHVVGINAKGEIIYRGSELPHDQAEFMKNLKQGL